MFPVDRVHGDDAGETDEPEMIERVRSRLVALGAWRPGEIRFVQAPYRVSPLGAHVDHQLGRVTGLAIDRGILLAFAPRDDGHVRLASLDFPGEASFALEAVPPPLPGAWTNYVHGAASVLRDAHSIRRGLDGVVAGSLPVGGLSSSAALGVACLLALETANGLEVSIERNIECDRRIENEYLGLQNGILDPSVILAARRGELLHLDCLARSRESLPFGGDPSRLGLLVVFSGLSRALISTDYNRHVHECREAARRLLESAGLPVPEHPVLGLVPGEVLASGAEGLPESLSRRVRHFRTESARVREGLVAWEEGDLVRFGALMNASGESSRVDYRSGVPETILLREILAEAPGVHGARFSGGGYGGACLALIEPRCCEDVVRHVEARYLRAHPECRGGFAAFLCASADGASAR